MIPKRPPNQAYPDRCGDPNCITCLHAELAWKNNKAIDQEHAVAVYAVEALKLTRGQWIHSVNAKQCLDTLAEIEASGWKP